MGSAGVEVVRVVVVVVVACDCCELGEGVTVVLLARLREGGVWGSVVTEEAVRSVV